MSMNYVGSSMLVNEDLLCVEKCAELEIDCSSVIITDGSVCSCCGRSMTHNVHLEDSVLVSDGSEICEICSDTDLIYF